MENLNLYSQLRFSNCFHQLDDYFFSYQQPEPVNQPGLIHINPLMANQIDVDVKKLCSDEFYQMTSANKPWENVKSFSSNDTEHQFIDFLYPLEDDRKIIIGKVKTAEKQFRELQLRAIGKNSHGGVDDGRAALHSIIREYLCSESMAALNIPTTRSLAMIFSEEDACLEHIESTPSMIRISPSFIHFGHFKFFSSNDSDFLRSVISICVPTIRVALPSDSRVTQNARDRTTTS